MRLKQHLLFLLITISAFFRYLKKPLEPGKEKKINSIGTFFIIVVVTLLITYTIDCLVNKSWLWNLLKVSAAVTATNEYYYKQGIWNTFFIACIVAPLIEEFLFRGYLTCFILNNIFFIFNVFIIIILISGLDVYIIWGSQYPFLILCLVVSAGIGILILKVKPFKIKVIRFYTRYFWIYFYASAFMFGLLHLGYFQINNFIPILPVLLILPKVFLGLALGYVRLNMGLKWSIVLHSLYNFSYFVILYFIHQ